LIELGFEVKGYPGSRRRVEADRDLSQVSRPDLIQGAFMGDAIVRFGDVDFSTHFGWVTLIDWCLRLTVSVQSLASVDSTRFSFSESDDFMSFERIRDGLRIECSYSSEVAVIRREEDLAYAVRDFVDSRMGWIAREFPAAMLNPAMSDVLSRLQLSFPQVDNE
jgi:hypothetical protein